MKKKSQSKLSVFPILLVLTLTFLLAIPLITHENNPADSSTTSNTSIELNFNITEANLKEVKYNWNGTNYTVYDTSNLVLDLNMNNLSILGENDTHIFDISGSGNNGTVVGGAVFNSSGKYDGAFEFDGINNKIDCGNDQSLNITEDVSWSLWIKPIEINVRQGLLYKGEVGWARLVDIQTDNKIEWFIDNSTDVVSKKSTGAITKDIWTHIVGTYNQSHIIFYINGIESGNYDVGDYTPFKSTTGSLWIGDGSPPWLSYFNGSIDEVKVWNKSLSSSEIFQLYKSSLKKYDTDKWSLYVNQIMATNKTGISYTYYSCATNSTGSENCTSTRTITRIPTSQNTTSNFSLSIGDINDYFYGLGLQSPRYGRNIDTDCDGSYETSSNITFQQNAILNSGAKIAYYGIVGFENYYFGLNNPDLEYWTHPSVGYFDSWASSGAYGWVVDGDSGGTGYVSMADISHDKEHSMNITGNYTGSGSVYNMYSIICIL